MGKVSRRSFLVFASTSLASTTQSLRAPLRWAESSQAKLPERTELSQGVVDLYDIFKDEIRTNYKDNVYASLGNKLHLDGEPYVKVSQALIAHDPIEISHPSPMSETHRQTLLKDQIAKTETTFLNAVKSLDWPQYSVEIGVKEIRVSGPSHLSLYAHKSELVMFAVRNFTASTQTVRFTSEGITLTTTTLKVEPGASRYVLAEAYSKEKGNGVIKVMFTSGQKSRDLIVDTSVAETAILDGLLVADEQDPERPMARIRIVDSHGRYFSPEVEPSGLIRMLRDGPNTRAERWFYIDGRFKARVPLGKIKVSIRRALEYRSLDEHIDVKAGGLFLKKFELSRWAQMEKDGWYCGDLHAHNLDGRTALFESRAECLNFVNVMVYRHLKYIGTKEHFTGGVDPASDDRHFIYFNEEFRNEPMGHLELINLKKLVEPIATGRLGLPWPAIETYEDLSMPLPFHGDTDSPDFPLLLEAMRETHKQGGLVGWAHLRRSEWEFPLDAAEGQIDFADIMTHTDLPQDLQLWYALLNCDFQIPACAGTDRQEPVGPIGHQRVYVRLDALSYASWIKGLKAGTSFVTNGPMVQLQANAIEPGGRILLKEPTQFTIVASAFSQIPFDRLEIIMNGEIVGTGRAKENGLSAEITLKRTIDQSVWIAARCLGPWHQELFYSNPVFAHTSPVYISYRDARIAKSESANSLLGFLRKLQDWAQREAYFKDNHQKTEVLSTIQGGMQYFEKISQQPN